MRRSVMMVVLAACTPGSSARSPPPVPADAKTTVFSLADTECGSCAQKLVVALLQEPGVYRARFDLRRAEVTVIAAPSVDAVARARSIATATRDAEYTIVPGAGHGSYLAWKVPPPSADVATVAAEGADVKDLASVAVRGKVTVVDFSALWCEPCRSLDEHMAALAGTRADIAYRKLDVGDWDTPLAKHYLTTVRALPYVVVYDKSGAKIDSFSGLDLARLDADVERGSQ